MGTLGGSSEFKLQILDWQAGKKATVQTAVMILTFLFVTIW